MGTGRTERKPLAPDFNGSRPPTVISVEAYQDEHDHENWVQSKRDTFTTWWYTRSPKGRYTCMGLTVLIVVGSVVGIVLGVTGSGGGSPPAPAPAPIAAPMPTNSGPVMDDPANREANILAKLERRVSTAASLQDESSPQYAALRWILDTDSMQLQSSSPFLAQRYALVVLFNVLGGSDGSWIMDDLWIDESSGDAGSECLWEGVECNEDSLIQNLFLNEMGLQGQLPIEISALSELKKLDMRGNSLSGELPNEIANLKHLTLLLLEGNKGISGSVPDDVCRTVEWVTVECDVVTCNCCANCNDHNVTVGVNGPILTGNVTAGRISLINILVGPVSPDSKTPGSPQNVALNWILYGDDRKLSVDDNTLLQRYVLAVLYYSLAGDGWSFADSWLTGDSECKYPGVACNEFGFVTTIAMVDSNLKGVLPPELGLLDELGFLDLSNNYISGVVPVQLSELDSLESLLLQGNNIGGSVPSRVCVLREGTLWEFKTDCGGLNPKVTCGCCTNCASVVDDGSEGGGDAAAAAGGRGDDANAGNEESPKLDYHSLFGRRGKMVALTIEEVSEDIYIPDSTRADAMEWILKEDTMSLEHDDSGLVQRWIMTLMYFQLGGANWVYTNYLNENHECQWDGVSCNEDDEVTEIVLTDGGLMGAVPYELGALDKLKILDLHGNFIEGEAPEEFCLEEEDSSQSLEKIIFDCMDPPLVDCDCCDPCDGATTAGPTTPASPQKIDYSEKFGRRGQRIAEALEDVSEEIYDLGSSRAAAAEWIIEKDAMELEHSDPLLAQRFLLGLLYFQLDGSNWIYSNFLTGEEECNWDGITCNDDDEVIEIVLPEGGLMGVVPYELGALDTLKALDVHGNRIEGEAPEEFCIEKEDSSAALEKLVFDCLEPPLVDCDCCTPCEGSATDANSIDEGNDSATDAPDEGDSADEGDSSAPDEPGGEPVDYQTIAGRRGVHIAQQLGEFSEKVNDSGSGEALATIWLVRDDNLELEHDDDGLLQRWIVALLYFQTDGPNWEVSKFLTADTECDWEGITCNDSGDVTSIVVTETGLMGVVPPELAMLDHLTTLDLRGNRLEGEVPEDLCFVETIETMVFDCGEPPLFDCDCCTPC